MHTMYFLSSAVLVFLRYVVYLKHLHSQGPSVYIFLEGCCDQMN